MRGRSAATQLPAEAGARAAHLCAVCQEEPARIKSPLCNRCAAWVNYHRAQNAFQFRLYQGRVHRALTRILQTREGYDLKTKLVEGAGSQRRRQKPNPIGG